MNTNFLPLILEAKKNKLEILKKNREGIASLLKSAPKVRSLKEALLREGKISVIAELKQASPSAGVIRKDFSPVDLAEAFSLAGAQAVSVITEEDFFLGKKKYIEQVRAAVNIPVLRKDFILDEVQILESRALGADAVLLIMKIIDEQKYQQLYSAAKDLGMDVVTEVNTEKELRKVLKFKPDIIGVNNRNLQTMAVDLERTKKLAPFIPSGIVRIAMSGISSLKDVLLCKGLGLNAVLIGETLMRAEHPGAKLKELIADA